MTQDEPKTVEQLNEEADIAADYLEGLLDIADYDGDIEMGIRNNRPTVQIVADDDEDIKHLIGRNGEVVDALQQLTRLAVQQKTGERSHLIVDVDGYLKRKRQHLRDLALDAVDEVRENGEPVSLDPMNSFERKVVHDLIREEGLKSRSHGEEPHRYVTVYAKAEVGAGADADPDELADDGFADDDTLGHERDLGTAEDDSVRTRHAADRHANRAVSPADEDAIDEDSADEDSAN